MNVREIIKRPFGSQERSSPGAVLSKNDVGFRGRLAYVRWLRARGRVQPESDRDLALAVGVTEGWLYKWKDRIDPPDSRKHSDALCAGLGVDSEWLLYARGTPPEPPMWKAWLISPKLAALETAGDEAQPRTKPTRRVGGGRKGLP